MHSIYKPVGGLAEPPGITALVLSLEESLPIGFSPNDIAIALMRSSCSLPAPDELAGPVPGVAKTAAGRPPPTTRGASDPPPLAAADAAAAEVESEEDL